MLACWEGNLIFISKIPDTMKSLTVAVVLFSGLLLSAPGTHAQVVGKTFPTLTGEALDGKSVTLPAAAKGKYTLIGMAHSTDAEQDLQSWIDPVYQKYIAKTGLLDAAEDINVYFIPMFSGSNLLFFDKAKKQMKETTQEDLQSNVIFYKGSIDTYVKELQIDKKDTPYIFLMDGEGKIVYTTSGNWTEAKMDAIDDKIN
jgi:hypothetical protein